MIVECRRCGAKVRYPRHAHTQSRGYMCCKCLGHGFEECYVTEKQLLRCKGG